MNELAMLLLDTGRGLFHMIIFPGGVFALFLGLYFKGLDRIIEARLQRRVGPPVMQNFWDIIKLCTKESTVPNTAQKSLFRFAPLIGFTGMVVCAALLPIPGVYKGLNNMGDMLVYFYLLPLPAIALMIAGSSSSSPFGAIGFSREMTIMFAYEVPLLLVILSVAIVTGQGNAEFSLGAVVNYQAEHGAFGFNPKLIPALIAYLMFIPATMGVPPFDIPEAETEIIEGPLLEYSGAGLAFFQFTSAIKMIVVLGLGVVMFFPGTLVDGGFFSFINIFWFIFKCLVLMVVSITVVKAACARLRIEQALSFFLKYPTILAALSLLIVWLTV